MDYEKAYKEALERAKSKLTNIVAGDIFPELKESEDERIRKEIIHYILYKAVGLSETQEHNWVTYLEKLKEYKPLSTEETELNSIAFLEQMGYTCIPPKKEQKPVGDGTRAKIISRATSEKQVVLVSESDGNTEIGWDTRSLEDVKNLLEYGNLCQFTIELYKIISCNLGCCEEFFGGWSVPDHSWRY